MPDHFSHLLHLVELESGAEANTRTQQLRAMSTAAAEKTGQAFRNMVVRDVAGGFGGRVLVSFAKPAKHPMPWTRLSIGSPVLVGGMKKGGGDWKGVVCEITAEQVQVSFGKWEGSSTDGTRYRIDFSSDEVARRRQRRALQVAELASGGRLRELRQVLVPEPDDERGPRFESVRDCNWLDSSLNESQKEAVRFGLSAADIAFVHGPPGTGKTTTLVELIRQAVRRGEKVLACAPSNLAVDNLFERLLNGGERAVRLGHPARVLPKLRDKTLDIMVGQHREMKLVRDMFREARDQRAKAAKHFRTAPEPGARKLLRDQASALVREAKQLERNIVDHLIDSATVLCVTATGLDDDILQDRRFDVAVIDEACQGTEPECWIPIIRCGRIILAGDHCQLPPTVLSRQASRAGLSISLPERLIEHYGPTVARRLTVQYRMNRQIMDFSSAEFYDGALEADDSVGDHLLAGLPEVACSDLVQSALLFLDTAGAGFDEKVEADGDSRWNPGEVSVVLHFLGLLLDSGVPAEDIAVISPYAAQVREIRGRLSATEVDTVDGFQGREKEAVIVSLVRSNLEGNIGFLSDIRRTNVALTRARRKLIVIGDSSTISHHPFYSRLVAHFEALNAYKTIWEFPELV